PPLGSPRPRRPVHRSPVTPGGRSRRSLPRVNLTIQGADFLTICASFVSRCIKSIGVPKMPETNNIQTLPLLPLKNTVLFPYLLMPLSVGRASSLAAVEAALATEEKEIVV